MNVKTRHGPLYHCTNALVKGNIPGYIFNSLLDDI